MKNLNISFPAFGFVVGTRIALAFGLGLLVSGRIPEVRRRKIGLALATIGAITTFPAVRSVLKSQEDQSPSLGPLEAGC